MSERRAADPTDPLTARAGLRIRPYRPLRALIGGGVAIVCLLVGWAVIADAATKHDVLVLTREVQSGEPIRESDLRVLSIAWDEEFPAFSAAELGSVVGQHARYRLALGAVLAPDNIQDGPLVGDGRVLMSVSVPAGRIPTNLAADSRVWLIASAAGTCAESTVVIDAIVIDAPESGTSARFVAVSVEVPPDYVAAVGVADTVSIALWSRDDPPPVPTQTGDASGCPTGPASSPGSGSDLPGAPPTTGTFLIDGSDIILPPTSTTTTPS